MNLEKIFEAQKVLDERIVKEKELENQDLTENTKLALFVEISELANETRCFKHWSNKGASNKEVILEEFVDGVHFFISLALKFGIKPKDFNVTCDYTEETLTESFNELYKMLAIDIKENLNYAFSLFIGIAEKFLGFTWEQIENAYFVKNKINHQRQESGY